MPQTLLALFALVLASLMAFNQQKLTVRSHGNIVSDELELAAAGVASEVIGFIDGRSFDENTTPERIGDGTDFPDDPSHFSDAAGFGIDGACSLLAPATTPDCDDVDDVHSDGWRSAEIVLAHGRTLPFEVRTQVYYVADPEGMDPAPGPTLHKRVLVDVRSPFAPGASEGLYRATRVISYDPVKAEMDWENSAYYDPAYGDSGTTSETGGTTSETSGGA